MPTPNIPQVTTANTFDQWRIQTNNLTNVANELRNTTYEKEAGLLYLSNTTIDTALHVKSNVIIEGILTLGSPGRNVIKELANSANTTSVSANGGSIQYNSRINFVNSETLLVSVSAGSSGNANVQFEVVGGVGGTGAQGAQGRQGSRGFQGLTGTNGTNGSPGAAGTPGTNGTNGSPGAQGEIGAQGLRGAQGFQGDRGFQGFQGAPGTGAPGAQGNTGSPGSPGAQGEPGIGATPRAADSTSTGAMAYAGFTSAAGQFYGGTTNPSGTTRLNYAGHLYATKLYGDGSSITGLPSGLAARAATSSDTGAVAYNGNTEATGQFYGGTTVPTGSTRINYSGYLYATRFYGDATYLSNLPTTTPTRAASSTSTGAMAYNGDTSAAGQFYGGTTSPSGTTRLNYDGDFYVYNLNAINDITAFVSDERLKDIEGNIEGALGKVQKLNGFFYRFNDTAKNLGYVSDERMVGVSAQQVKEILPEVIADAPIDNKYMTVHYDKLVPLLIEAIKELKKEVDELRGKI
jgi:phosphatidylethanolamine-binding protein (PEBP) family uncharacterized protein